MNMALGRADGRPDLVQGDAPAKNSSIKRRAVALLIDALLLWELMALVTWLTTGGALTLPSFLSLSVLRWVLPTLVVLGCWQGFGATPGKLVMGITVVDARQQGDGRLSLRQSVLRWIAFLASALPLGIGFFWLAIDPQRHSLHDRLAGTRVIDQRPGAWTHSERRPAQRSRPRRLWAFAQAHWRGELPLPVSLWANTLLALAPLPLLVALLDLQVNVEGALPRIGSLSLLLAWPLLFLLTLWSTVGTWRAGQAHIHMGRDPQWALAAYAIAALAAALTLYSSATDFLPRTGAYLQMARGVDPEGQAVLSLSNDGGQMRLTGPIGMGDSTQFLALVAKAPSLRVLEIESPGGPLLEARRIAEAVFQRRLRVRVIGPCEGTCSLVFMAGLERQVMPGAHLGFASISPGFLKPLLQGSADASISAAYRRFGTPQLLITRMLASQPDRPWHPSSEQLIAEGVIPPMPQTLDIELPPATDIDAQVRLKEALINNPVWYWVEKARPGAVDAAAARMAGARNEDASSSAGAVLAEGQGVIAALLPGILRTTSNELRGEYMQIWHAQLKAARKQGSASCTRVMAGDAAAKRQLPQDVIAREAEWLIKASMQSDANATNARDRPLSAGEQALLSHQLGDRAPAVLTGMFESLRQRSKQADCDRTIAALEAVARLKPNVQQVAARALFRAPLQ